MCFMPCLIPEADRALLTVVLRSHDRLHPLLPEALQGREERGVRVAGMEQALYPDTSGRSSFCISQGATTGGHSESPSAPE